MARLRPQTDEEKKNRDYTIPAGRYVLGAEEFERKHPKEAGKHDFIKVKWFVVGPGSRGRHIFLTLSCDLSKDGTRIRWVIWMEALGIKAEFEIGDAAEGMETVREGDRNIGLHFMGRAIVVELDRVQNNGYWNNDIKKYLPRDKWTEKELAAAEKWEAEFRAKVEQRGDPTDYVDDGDDGPPPDDFDGPPPEDDDAIPW